MSYIPVLNPSCLLTLKFFSFVFLTMYICFSSAPIPTCVLTNFEPHMIKIHSNCVSPTLFVFTLFSFYPSFLCVICSSSLSSILPPLRPSRCRVKWPRPPACQPASICLRPWCKCCWTRSWNRSAWGPFSSSTLTSSSVNVSWSAVTLTFHCYCGQSKPKQKGKGGESPRDIEW